MFVYIPVTDCGALKSRGLLLLSKQASKTCLPRVNFRLITAERVRTFLFITVADIYQTSISYEIQREALTYLMVTNDD